MGGQACVLYGAAEFSRDTDLVLMPDLENLARVRGALHELRAECIAVPPFEPHYLEMGLAVHFRCHHPEADGLRVDVMTKLRGVAPFDDLWPRRTTLIADGQEIEVLSLPDLVQAKKTQCAKDWPMLARLLETSYLQGRDQPTREQILFWLRELRTPDFLMEAAGRFAAQCEQVMRHRPLLQLAGARDSEALTDALHAEQQQEREVDRQYWLPLRVELERLRQSRRRE